VATVSVDGRVTGVGSLPFLILSGPPGSGKTTVGRLVAERYDRSAVIESDWFWTTISRGFVRQWEPEADNHNQVVIRSVFAVAARMAAGGYRTVVEGIVGPWYLDLVRQELRIAKVAAHYVVLRPDLAKCLGRAKPRAGEERVPRHPALTEEGPVRYMWQQFTDLGKYTRYAVDSTGLSQYETAEIVSAGMADGRFALSTGWRY
jgi:gluconate kinase